VSVRSGLDSFFCPSGCAILGASGDPQKAGHQIVRNMLDAGGPGGLYPVNPTGDDILGLEGYSSLADIPGQVEMVILAVPAKYVESVVADLRQRQESAGDIRALVVVAAGFAETGTRDGQRRQALLLDTCKELGIRVLGPNCVGIIDWANGMNTTFIMGTQPKTGGISFVSQSGAVGAWLVETWSSGPVPVGLSKFISVGNMADVDLVEILDYLRSDPATKVVGMYLEGYHEGRRLARALRRLTAEKPVVVLKVGRSDRGAEAAHSHTGSMAGSDRIYDGIFRQVGVRRVSSVEELSDTLQAFDRLPLPGGPNAFLITQAGGPGIYCADTLEDQGETRFARVTAETRRALTEALPPFASVCRPEGHSDITAAATASQHARAVELTMLDESVDAVLLVTVPVLFVPPEDIASELIDVCSRLAARGINKPLLPVLLAGEVIERGRQLLDEAGLLTFETPDRAARALGHLVGYARFLDEQRGGAGHGEQ